MTAKSLRNDAGGKETHNRRAHLRPHRNFQTTVGRLFVFFSLTVATIASSQSSSLPLAESLVIRPFTPKKTSTIVGHQYRGDHIICGYQESRKYLLTSDNRRQGENISIDHKKRHFLISTRSRGSNLWNSVGRGGSNSLGKSRRPSSLKSSPHLTDEGSEKTLLENQGVPSSPQSASGVRGGQTDDKPIQNGTAVAINDDSHTQSENQVKKDFVGSGGDDEKISMWPRYDELDKRIMKIALPCIANFAINPLIGAVDLFWVNRMGNALAVAGQAAANQVFNSAFWVISFLPSVTATLVSKANAKGNEEELQDAVSQALVVGFYMSLIGTVLMLRYPEKVLSSVLKDGAPALQYAKPYLFIRSFSFLPSLISIIGFSAFRGVLDTSTPLKVSVSSNLFNAIVDPILMFTFAMGVPGAALATLGAEIISASTFIFLMLRRKMFRWSKIFRLPSWSKLKPLLKGGAALQLRNVALNVMFLAVTRVTQSLDDTGVAAAAHALAIQVFQVGGIVLLALSTVAQIVVPNELIEKVDENTGKRQGGKSAAKNVVNRLMGWGFVLGVILGTLQVGLLPFLQKSSPLEEVRKAAVMPSLLASVYQIINGLVFIGEGVMVGCGNFMQLSLSTVSATAAAVVALKTLPSMFGLTGVWMSFGVWNICRLAGVWLHQTKTGPLATMDEPNSKAVVA